MKRALVILLLIGCGGGAKQTPVENKAEPVEARIEDEPVVGAVVVQRTATDGVLELRGGNTDVGMEDANVKMSEHCGPGNYQITSEGVEITGADSYSDGTVDEVRVWRVHYACLGP